MIHKLLKCLGLVNLVKPKTKRYVVRVEYDGGVQLHGVFWGLEERTTSEVMRTILYSAPEQVHIDEVVDKSGPYDIVVGTNP